MCDCHKEGCSYNTITNSCESIGKTEGEAVKIPEILPTCTAANTEAACLKAIAWKNRYGLKTDCAWCSVTCVAIAHADDTCKSGNRLKTLLETSTIAITDPTQTPDLVTVATAGDEEPRTTLEPTDLPPSEPLKKTLKHYRRHH